MDLEMTFEDPKYYIRPFTLKTAGNLLPDTDVLDFVCAQNEKDRAHLGSDILPRIGLSHKAGWRLRRGRIERVVLGL